MTTDSGTRTTRIGTTALRPAGLCDGDRVVAVRDVTSDRIEIFGFGTYRHSTAPSRASVGRIADGLRAGDAVGVEFGPMLDLLCAPRSPQHAERTRRRFRTVDEHRRSLHADDRARALAERVHHDRRIDLERGGSVSADHCWVMRADAFAHYAHGSTVVTVTGP
jgi:hypothetical protein